jgi:hypothetical protein
MKDIKSLCDLFKGGDVLIFPDGLKAQDVKARGNAPGNVIPNILRPGGARQVFARSLSRTFRAEILLDAFSQGVALGYHVIALSARGI